MDNRASPSDDEILFALREEFPENPPLVSYVQRRYALGYLRALQLVSRLRDERNAAVAETTLADLGLTL